MLETHSKIWWNDITGPSLFISAITAGLLTAKNVVILVPEDLPWRCEMRDAAERSLHEEGYDLYVQHVDCHDENEFFSEGRSCIPEYLLTFAEPDIRNGYRNSARQTLQQYLLKNQVLNSRVLWIKDMNKHQTMDWLTFCKDYRARTQYDGLFVLECCEDVPQRGVGSNVLFIRYRDYVSSYDALLFDHMLVSQMEWSVEWKQYIAAVTASLCDCDVQMAELIINRFDMQTSIVDCLTDVAKDFEYYWQSADSSLTPTHPLSLLRSGGKDALIKRIWKAQLEILFPLIEIERLALINRYSDKIQEALNTPYYHVNRNQFTTITQFGEPIDDPRKTELGTIHRMTHLRKADDKNQYLLYLPKEEDRERLNLLLQMRNTIAHGGMCSTDDVATFLNTHPYAW